MKTEPRKYFNVSLSEEKYQNLIEDINKEFPGALDFRIAESPVFIDKELKIKILNTCSDIIDAIKKDDFIAKTNRAIPAGRKIDNENTNPNCLAIDFAITKKDG